MSEHQTREYKQTWRNEYLKWICGFANTLEVDIDIIVKEVGI